MSPPAASGAGTDAQLTALWLARFASAHTRAGYARDVRACLASAARAAGAPVALAGLTVADLMAWRAQRCAQGRAPATVNRGLAAVTSLLAFAQRTGYLSRNVGRAVEALPAPCRLAERILDETAVQRLLQAGRSRRDRLFLHFLYYAGCRVTEATGLCWRDLAGLDAPDPTRPVVAALHGKGGRTRHVPLPAFLGQALRAWRRHAAGPADAPVFATRTGRRLDRKQAWQMVRAAARRAGLAPPVSPHWLRHAHASHALDRGAPVHVVQATLGHASLATTSRYAHVRPGVGSGAQLAPAAARLEA